MNIGPECHQQKYGAAALKRITSFYTVSHKSKQDMQNVENKTDNNEKKTEELTVCSRIMS